jgi:fatty-acyl-CoA synthase
MDLSSLVGHWSRWSTTKVALRFEESAITYAELERRVSEVAAWLTDRGVVASDRVAYLGPNSPELLELLFACARTGAIFVPLNSRMPAPELRALVAHCRPRLIVAERAFFDVARESVPESSTGEVISFAIGGNELREAVRVGDAAPADLSAPVLIAYTSGTTGPPKGAVFTNLNLVFNAVNALTAFGLTADDNVLTTIPMFHVGGLLIQTTPALYAGAAVTIHRAFEPGLMITDLERLRVTVSIAVPAMTSALVAHPAWPDANFGTLRWLHTGSTFVPKSAVEPWHRKGVRVAQVYGLTETCPVVTVGDGGDGGLTAGRPVMHHRVRIVDRDGSDRPVGEPGEIWIRGPSMMRGYWENSAATGEAFQEGWFKTGDLGSFDEDGYLHVVDRLKDIIIVGGSNVYPADVEAVLQGSGDIREAAVVARPDDQLGEVPVAFVVVEPGRSLTREQVMGLFDGRLAGYKQPRDVVFLGALPRTALGKVQRSALRARAKSELRTGGAGRT